MDENSEVASKLSFLASINLGYKNEYEFGNGIECFNFINKEFLETDKIGIENIIYASPNSAAVNENNVGFTKIQTRNAVVDSKNLTVHSNKNRISSKKISKAKPKNVSYGCNICRREFPSNIERTTHVIVHLKKHMCPFCAKKFTQKSDLLKHCTLHLTKKSSPGRDKNLNKSKKRPSTSLEKFQCLVCLKFFTRKYSLKKHLENHHLQEKCHICFQVINKNELQRHIRTHDRKDSMKNTGGNFECPFTLQTFANTMDVMEHLRNIHVKQNAQQILPYTDKHNPNKYVYSVLDNMQCPIFNNTNYKCPTLTPVSLKRHINIVHLKQKTYKCGVCEKQFVSSRRAKRHFQAHNFLQQINEKYLLKQFPQSLILKVN